MRMNQRGHDTQEQVVQRRMCVSLPFRNKKFPPVLRCCENVPVAVVMDKLGSPQNEPRHKCRHSYCQQQIRKSASTDIWTGASDFLLRYRWDNRVHVSVGIFTRASAKRTVSDKSPTRARELPDSAFYEQPKKASGGEAIDRKEVSL
jgi:hypothetical protein